jgi:predicted nucleotidyltransferase
MTNNYTIVLGMKDFETIKKVLEKEKNVVIAYVYGSFARGNYTENSDIDNRRIVEECYCN